MLAVHVHVRVLPESIADFIEATSENARHSRSEPGIARFDVVQDASDPTCFVLVEVYRSDDAPKAHKETLHYRRWRDTVESMMAEPRQSRKYRTISPEPADW